MMEMNKKDQSIPLPRRISAEDLSKLHTYYTKNLAPEALEYLKRRGITEETAESFELGFEPFHIGFQAGRAVLGGYFTNYLVFPVKSAEGDLVDLVGRTIFEDKPKYKALVGRGDIFFNEVKINQSDDILLCKNVFDVLSLEQAHLPAICISDSSSFKESHAQKLAGKTVFICYPNDEPGRRESNKIDTLLQGIAKEIYTVFLPEGFRDINQFFLQVKNPAETFHSLLNDTVEESLKVPVAPDIRNLVVFMEEYQKRNNGDVRGISTGFTELDELLFGGLRTGLYLISGSVSSGKSMFLRQIADQIASNGNPVVYVSWDMTSFELWSRSMARLLHASPRDVLAGKMGMEQMIQANQDYTAIAKNIWTLEGSMDTSMDEVEEYVERIVQSIGKVPAVFIDHLNRIPVKSKEGVLLYHEVPYISYQLHQWSRQWNTPIVVITSMLNKDQSINQIVEGASDVILSMESDHDPGKSKDQEKISLHLKKNRNGMLGKLSLVFDKEKAVFNSSQA